MLHKLVFPGASVLGLSGHMEANHFVVQAFRTLTGICCTTI